MSSQNASVLLNYFLGSILMAFVDSWQNFECSFYKGGFILNLFSSIPMPVFLHYFSLSLLLELIIMAISSAFWISHSVPTVWEKQFSNSFNKPLQEDLQNSQDSVNRGWSKLQLFLYAIRPGAMISSLRNLWTNSTTRKLTVKCAVKVDTGKNILHKMESFYLTIQPW